jgi:hypothetical protein
MIGATSRTRPYSRRIPNRLSTHKTLRAHLTTKKSGKIHPVRPILQTHENQKSHAMRLGTPTNRTVPTLFSTALPPCGLVPQLAYENIVHRLRALWLSRSQNPSANLSVTSLCRVILADLKTEEDQPISQALKPWRRSSVFAYEVRWARYFVREAETMDKRPTMTEKQADKQDFMDRM